MTSVFTTCYTSVESLISGQLSKKYIAFAFFLRKRFREKGVFLIGISMELFYFIKGTEQIHE